MLRIRSTKPLRPDRSFHEVMMDLIVNPPRVPLSPMVQFMKNIYMAATAWAFYETFRLWIADATFDMDADTFKMALYLSTSNAATLTTNSVLADLTNEHANASGYTTGGVTLTGVTWTRITNIAKFTSNNAQWTASGGSIVCRMAAIYKSGTANAHVNPLVCMTTLDAADVTTTTGNTLTIAPSGSGILQLQ